MSMLQIFAIIEHNDCSPFMTRIDCMLAQVINALIPLHPLQQFPEWSEQ